MHMEMEHRLSCNLMVILYQVESVTFQHIRHMHCQLLCKLHGICCHILVNLIEICIMLLRQNQCMSLACRADVKNNTEFFILINRVRRDLPCCDFTENTIFISPNSSFFLYLLSLSSLFWFFQQLFYYNCRIL